MVAEIRLTKGLISIVDNGDIELVSRHKWHSVYKKSCDAFYAYTRIYSTCSNSRMVPMHRMIMGEPYGFDIDHINHNSLDNTRSNLRAVTRSENNRNFSGLSRANRSGYLGVSWDRNRGLWVARVSVLVAGSRYYRFLGRFREVGDAARAYDTARVDLDPFAMTNRKLGLV